MIQINTNIELQNDKKDNNDNNDNNQINIYSNNKNQNEKGKSHEIMENCNLQNDQIEGPYEIREENKEEEIADNNLNNTIFFSISKKNNFEQTKEKEFKDMMSESLIKDFKEFVKEDPFSNSLKKSLHKSEEEMKNHLMIPNEIINKNTLNDQNENHQISKLNDIKPNSGQATLIFDKHLQGIKLENKEKETVTTHNTKINKQDEMKNVVYNILFNNNNENEFDEEDEENSSLVFKYDISGSNKKKNIALTKVPEKNHNKNNKPNKENIFPVNLFKQEQSNNSLNLFQVNKPHPFTKINNDEKSDMNLFQSEKVYESKTKGNLNGTGLPLLPFNNNKFENETKSLSTSKLKHDNLFLIQNKNQDKNEYYYEISASSEEETSIKDPNDSPKFVIKNKTIPEWAKDKKYKHDRIRRQKNKDLNYNIIQNSNIEKVEKIRYRPLNFVNINLKDIFPQSLRKLDGKRGDSANWRGDTTLNSIYYKEDDSE